MRHFRETRDGELWPGTNDGLLAWGGGSVRRWTRDDGLAGNIVVAIHEDPRGILWIGSRDSGLTRGEGETLFALGAEQVLPQPSVQVILKDDEGGLWLSGGEGLTWADRASLDAVARGEAAQATARLLRETAGGARQGGGDLAYRRPHRRRQPALLRGAAGGEEFVILL